MSPMQAKVPETFSQNLQFYLRALGDSAIYTHVFTQILHVAMNILPQATPNARHPYIDFCIIRGKRHVVVVISFSNSQVPPLLQQFCRQHGGHLIHVNDVEEDNFIRDRLREFSGIEGLTRCTALEFSFLFETNAEM